MGGEAKTWIWKWGWGFTLIMVVIWPVLSIPAGVFTKDYFAFWVFVSLAWSFVASFVIISLPLYESWDSIEAVLRAVLGMKQQPRGLVSSPSEVKPNADNSHGSPIQLRV